MLRAVARDPAQRYQSAHDMSEELDRFLLEGQSRPTTKAVGRWLETTFTTERASLKKAISQGGEVEAALDRLAALDAATRTASGDVTGSASGRAVVLEGAAARDVVDQLRIRGDRSG